MGDNRNSIRKCGEEMRRALACTFANKLPSKTAKSHARPKTDRSELQSVNILCLLFCFAGVVRGPADVNGVRVAFRQLGKWRH